MNQTPDEGWAEQPEPVRRLLSAHLEAVTLARVIAGQLAVQDAIRAVVGVLGRHSVSSCADCQKEAL